MQSNFIVSNVYIITTVVLTVATLVVSVMIAVRINDSAIQRTLAVTLLAPIAMIIGYLGMHFRWVTVATTGGGENSVFRFAGYTFAAVVSVYIFKELIELTVTQSVLLAGVFLSYPWGTFASWILSGIAGTIATLTIFASLVGGTYLLFRPVARIADSVGGFPDLYYTKLRNHLLLCMVTLTVLGALSEQALGVTTSFTGQVAASYVDVMYSLGIVVITYLGREALETDTTTQTNTNTHTQSDTQTHTATENMTEP